VNPKSLVIPSPDARNASVGTVPSVLAGRGDIAALFFLVSIIALVVWDRLGTGRALLLPDILDFYLPWFTELGQRLRANDIPGWSPQILSGAPFAGDPQTGWMYLPAMVSFVLFPPVFAYQALVAFHLVLSASSFYLLSRLLGFGPPASFVGAVAFVLAPPTVHAGCCTARTQVSAWLPVALIGIEVAVRAKGWPPRLVGWGITGLAISQWLASWLGQGAYYGLLLVGCFLVYRAFLSTPRSPRPLLQRARDFLLHGVGILLMSGGIAAAGLLTRLEVIARSSLAGGYDLKYSENTGWSHIEAFVALLNVPFFAAWTLGVIVLTLNLTPLHSIFFLLPKFENLHSHVPTRIVMVLGIGLAMLAAATVQALLDFRINSVLAVVISLSPILAFEIVDQEVRSHGGYISNSTQYFVVGTSLIFALWAIGKATTSSRFPHSGPAAVGLSLLIAGLIFWDTTGRWYQSGAPGAPRESYSGQAEDLLRQQAGETVLVGAALFLHSASDTGATRYFGYDISLARHGTRREVGYRFASTHPLAGDLLLNNRAVGLGLQDVQGFNPVQSQRYVDYIASLNGFEQDYHEAIIFPSGFSSPLLDLLNVRYIAVPVDVPPGRPDLLHLSQRYPTVFVDRRVRVLERPTALPRAWIVHAAQEMPADEALARLAAGVVDPRQTALVEDPPPALAQPAVPAADRADVIRYEGDHIALRTTTDAAGLLVLSEVYDPGWRAYVDGKRVDLLRADFLFRAVPIPAGEHSVEVRYQPPSLRAGIAITLTTGGVIATAAVAWLVSLLGFTPPAGAGSAGRWTGVGGAGGTSVVGPRRSAHGSPAAPRSPAMHPAHPSRGERQTDGELAERRGGLPVPASDLPQNPHGASQMIAEERDVADWQTERWEEQVWAASWPAGNACAKGMMLGAMSASARRRPSGVADEGRVPPKAC
jgi:hypothetical protein